MASSVKRLRIASFCKEARSQKRLETRTAKAVGRPVGTAPFTDYSCDCRFPLVLISSKPSTTDSTDEVTLRGKDKRTGPSSGSWVTEFSIIILDISLAVSVSIWVGRRQKLRNAQECKEPCMEFCECPVLHYM